MKIVRISVFRKQLHYARGAYIWGRGNVNVETTGKPPPRTENGLLYASDLPGHGVEPDYDSLGDAVAVYH